MGLLVGGARAHCVLGLVLAPDGWNQDMRPLTSGHWVSRAGVGLIMGGLNPRMSD